MCPVMSRPKMSKQRKSHFIRHLGAALLAAMTISPVPAFAASFDCGRAHQADAKAVCASRQLGEMDVEMSVRFEMLSGLVAMGTRGDMQDEQQAWLKSRKACGANQSCLVTAYRQRIDALKSGYAQLKSRGPF